MQAVHNAVRIAMPGVVAALLVASAEAAAQAFEAAAGSMPSMVLRVLPDSVRALDGEFADQARALDAFDGKSRVDRFTRAQLEKPVPWTFYGRLGIVNFQNRLEPQRFDGVQFSFRRTGPNPGVGRYYIGIHRQF
jgi:hypothetical protein